MSTRRAAPLDSSLLARKGDAAPAMADDPVPPPASRHTESAPAVAEAAVPSATPGGDRPERAGRFAPMLASRRGLAVLVAAACLAAVAVVAEQLWQPADRAPAAPVEPPAVGAPLSDSAAVDPPAEKDAAPPLPQPSMPTSPAFAAASPPAPEPAPAPVAAPSALPAPASEPALVSAVAAVAAVAAVVSDGPPPQPSPPRPVKKPAHKSAAAAPASGVSGPYSLQLAAFSDAKSAHSEAARLQERLDPVLAGRKVAVVTARNAADKPVYRLRTRAYRSLAAARAACDRIRKLESACLVIRR